MTYANGPRTGRPSVFAARGMVSSPHYLASASGDHILRRGGSAVDAAIAINATLCVVYPHMAGLGGDAFMLIAGGPSNKVEALEASGPSARLATREFYKQHGYDSEIPMRGPLAALTAPGVVDGWRLAHERYGKLPWKELFTDAIEYAKNGMAITRSLADWLVTDESILKQNADMTRIFLPQQKPQREGELLKQPELAKTFEYLAEHGPRQGFYEGPIAEEMAKSLEAMGSPLRYEDFSSYQACWSEPISSTYRGYEVFQLPPATQGFAALQILNLLEKYDVQSWGANSVEYYHHLVEAIKVAFVDRDEWLSDPKFVKIPLNEFISKTYAEKRQKLIDSSLARKFEEIKCGIKHASDAKREAPTGDTVYFCVADQDGLVVSNIQSIYHDFGACVVAGNTGVIMQNRGSFFSLDATHPNTLEPLKHTFHTIIPAMLMKDGKPVMAYGTMGGEGQPQTQAALLTRIIDFGYDVQQAIEAPRWLMGRTWGVATRDLILEARIPAEVIRELRLLGHPIKIAEAWDGSLGHAQAIRIHADTGLFEGGADPRGDGSAIGF